MLDPREGRHTRARLLLARLRHAWRAERGQEVVEYAGLLVLVGLVVAALGSIGIAGKIRSAVSCAIQRIEQNGCASAPSAATAAPAPAASTGAAGATVQALTNALGSRRLIDACAGGPTANGVAEQQAPDSAACKQQLARLSPHALATLALLAATIQSQQRNERGNFALLLESYLEHPGWAVIALSPLGQAEQASGNALLQKLQSSPGDLGDRLLGGLCGGYGLCLGGNVNTQAYQQAWHDSAQLGRISNAMLLATGVAGAVKDLSSAAVKAILSRLGRGRAAQVDQALSELEATSKQAGGTEPAGGTNPLALPRGTPTLSQQTLDHIVYRHFPASEAPNAGKFAAGTTGQDVKTMIDQTVQQGSLRPNTNGRPGTIYEYDFGHPIGTTRSGAPTSRLRVVVGPDGQVITAFPY